MGDLATDMHRKGRRCSRQQVQLTPDDHHRAVGGDGWGWRELSWQWRAGFGRRNQR